MIRLQKKDQEFINCNKSYFVKMFILAKEGYRVLCPLFSRRKGMLKKLIKITKGILYMYKNVNVTIPRKVLFS